MEPEVSLIIPIYNAERFLERCLNSLFTQSLTNIEFVFVDDCSTDNSVALLKKILNNHLGKREQVKLIQHKINKGVAASRNSGLENATGKYIGWVDADDYVEQDMFEKMYFKAKITQADMVWCNYYNVNAYGEMQEVKQIMAEDSRTFGKALLLNQIQKSIWNKLMKRSVFEENNLRFLEGQDMGEDYNILFKVLHLSNNIAYLNESLYYYCHNNMKSISKQSNRKRIDQELANMEDMLAFIQDQQTQDYTIEELEKFKFFSKKKLLYSKDIEDFRSWRNKFPEVNYLVNEGLLTHTHNFLAKMVVSENWMMVKAWLFLKSMKHRLSKRENNY